MGFNGEIEKIANPSEALSKNGSSINPFRGLRTENNQMIMAMRNLFLLKFAILMLQIS